MSRIADLTLTSYDADTAQQQFPVVEALYQEVFAEPPHSEGAEEFELFATRWWPKQSAQPEFQLIVATLGDEPVGCTYGHRLPPDTAWWKGAVEPLPEDLTEEYEGRTAALIEMMIRSDYRRRGIAAALHRAFCESRAEQRVTLTVRPDNDPARAGYAKWGYRKVGQIRPARRAPVYDAMILDL
ncbi:MAG: GNAT family N-acetyltransferase [Pseudonocardiaceae bacterium]